ncbi:MAG: YtxH domain-containing protein [Desulfobulbaceae bacterium]|nr:YtxH domain-containing protein [Desulfobulbaceae bacterium]
MLNNLLKLSGYFLLAREAADFVVGARDYRQYELKRKSTACTVTGTVIGITTGVVLGMLFAPRSGKETRELISNTTNDIIHDLQNDLTERKKHFDDILSRKKEEFCKEIEEHDETAG